VRRTSISAFTTVAFARIILEFALSTTTRKPAWERQRPATFEARCARSRAPSALLRQLQTDDRTKNKEENMKFGYFTLSDNHYENNTRSPNQFVADITAEALYADQLGMHSAWIGEHHFNSLGVLSCPDLVLAYVAARTKNIRLAPAVTVLPLHHPIRVAEQWASLDLLSNGRVDFAAGRGYDRREYLPFHVSFEDNQSIFDEGLELVRKLWSADERMTYKGKHYSFEDVRITPK